MIDLASDLSDLDVPVPVNGRAAQVEVHHGRVARLASDVEVH